MRKYDDELKGCSEHQYQYSFDLDVMHYYMMKAFKPFWIKNGRVLELGSHKGSFTKRLIEEFSDVTCIEASREACASLEKNIGKKVVVINNTFEETTLDEKYDNIILTHTLEHIEDRIGVLKKINQEWLGDNGRLFITCPNANAPSRQIAASMGLISCTTAITEAEHNHGHRITYTMETLEKDVIESGLEVVFKTGIFFKPFANFQWDYLLNSEIINSDYLEGCYLLGQKYPDLCASIFILCERKDASKFK